MRKLIEKYIFGPEKNRAKIYNKVKNKALKRGVFLASIAHLYKEIAKGNVTDFSVPAFNVRTLTFDTAYSIFKAAKKAKAGAFILEIASSEMDYTKQSPEEFALCVLGGAIKAKYKGLVFLQGDHFYLKDTTEQSISNLQNLILLSLKAGFYNLDIDCSALSLEENIKQTNDFIEFIKKNQPQGVQVAIGGEVSSIGGEETTQIQLEDFLKKVYGLTKVSCQTGTRHGGKVLPSGLVEAVNINFENIKKFGEIAKHYGLAGVVGHGASTLRENQFVELKKAGILEVHLSTLFMDTVFDSRYFPKDLKDRMYSWVEQNFAKEKQEIENSLQFIRIFRKKSLGTFKKQIWQMPEKNIKGIRQELEEKFLFFFKIFGVSNTQELVRKIYM
ncbi:MAG: class II fructose-bisphosphate aldolase [bacterium]